MKIRFTLRTKKIALSSHDSVYKTESFISLTRRIQGIDAFVSRVAEGIFREKISLPEKCFCAQTEDGFYTLFIRAVETGSGSNLIFYKYLCAKPEEGGVDRRLKEYLGKNDLVPMIMTETDDVCSRDDLRRLYLVSASDGVVNFPNLNETQRKIVETEDANMLVQGVAGSGKTNVCVEKIVFCACRNYRGKALYTTFSHGLLTETRNRVELFKRNIDEFLESYASGDIEYLDPNHKKAVENKLGILFSVDGDEEIADVLKRISAYLADRVDYMLIEDIYAKRFGSPRVAGERTFTDEYLGGRNFRLSGAYERIKHISPEIIYKEIYGMIFGKYELAAPKDMLGREEYIEQRKESFIRRECEIIHSIAVDYAEFLKRQGYTDNNFMSRELIGEIKSEEYSVGVIDEAQDFTQVNLCLIKKLCRKMFCVGDAMQMINPSYFNFGYLKRLMYGDITGVSELKHNYRSTQRIEKIAEKLGEMNIGRFGTHSFVLKGECVPSPIKSEAVFVRERNFVNLLGDGRYDNLTVIVGSREKKEKLLKVLKNTEVLTVAEAKGLERNAVILADVLTDNAEKWKYLQQMTLNRKTADENSVFRYYFNLFYVGISRAKQYLLVAESDYPKFFDKLFDECFERRARDGALAFLKDIAGKTEIGDEEFIERIEKFCSLEQYENARMTADRLSSEELRKNTLVRIAAHEKFIRYGKYREAGVEYWKNGMDGEAREMFIRSGDEALFPLMDACLKGGTALDPEIVRFYTLVGDNETAKNIILETLDGDSKRIAAEIRDANAKMKRKR